MGFGLRVQELRPRATIIKKVARRLRGHGQNPLLDIALKLEAALSDPYFIERKLY
jgi:citrate synthase